jgi:signal transduction histidine kinase
MASSMTQRTKADQSDTVTFRRPSESPRLNILLCDDRPENLMAFETVLAPLDQNVISVRSGADALRELLHKKFAVILLDVRMPGMDGYETASLIRQRQASQYTPIIFVTAGGPQDTHVSRGYALGGVDYLFSPVDPGTMRAKVSVFIELARKAAIIQEQAEQLRTAAEKRAERAENRLQGLLDTLEVGVYRTTLDGVLLDANRAFLQLMNLKTADDPAFGEIRQVGTGASLPTLLGNPEGVELTGLPEDHEIELPGGRRAWFSVRRAVVGGDRDPACVEGILGDISERKRSEQLLRDSNRALQRSNEDLNQFAYAASHDLREPLRIIGSYSELIRRRYGEWLERDGREFLGYVIDGAKRMNQLLTDLLLYARVAHFSTEIAAAPIEAGRAFDLAVMNLAKAIEDSGAEVTREDLPRVTMEETHLVQLFQNLIGNAIKYRRGDPPTVRVTSQRVDNTWRFAVADNGLGIPEDHKTQVFGIFKRLHGQDYPGTGIGLAICAKIVERYGGAIWVDSTVGQGSTFYFTAR